MFFYGVDMSAIFDPNAENDEEFQAWLNAPEPVNPERSREENFYPGICLWIIVGLRKKNFSEHIEWHKDAPAMVPKPGYGELKGIVSRREDIEDLITPDHNKENDPRREYVYLIYKARFKENWEWQELLDFLAARRILEKDCSG